MPFISKEPQLEDYWRGIILFGRNVASYKFALAKTLLELKPASGELVKLGDLALTYARYLSAHIKHSDRQGTSKSSKFLDACRRYNAGEMNRDELTKQTIRDGFVNVIDAFHVIGHKDIPKRFYIDERKENSGIRITDEFSDLLTRQQSSNLPQEVEARWRLVETAWELNVSSSLLSIGYDGNDETFFALDRHKKRQSVTGSRDALNGYQKGKCFYCFTDIDLNQSSALYPEVDHFFPHTLKQNGFSTIVDGVWNLVLSCRECNRGAGGKFARIPTIRLLERLNRRNEFLISSHHPLRETLIRQTGSTEEARTKFLNDFHSQAWSKLIHQWEPEEKDRPYF